MGELDEVSGNAKACGVKRLRLMSVNAFRVVGSKLLLFDGERLSWTHVKRTSKVLLVE